LLLHFPSVSFFGVRHLVTVLGIVIVMIQIRILLPILMPIRSSGSGFQPWFYKCHRHLVWCIVFVLMQIRILLSILMPADPEILVRVLTLVLQMLKSEFFYFGKQQCQSPLFFLSRKGHRWHNIQYFGQYRTLIEIFRKSII
jgi:hypothetical protein